MTTNRKCKAPVVYNGVYIELSTMQMYTNNVFCNT